MATNRSEHDNAVLETAEKTAPRERTKPRSDSVNSQASWLAGWEPLDRSYPSFFGTMFWNRPEAGW